MVLIVLALKMVYFLANLFNLDRGTWSSLAR